MAGLAAIAALAVGGASLASAAGKAPPVNPPVAAVDGDTVQQGDQTSPDTGTAAEQSSSAASETSTSETSAEQPAESSSEIVSNDGPGGHADEPANATADYQFQGQQ
jgi:hypothetical protein